jgi:replicative DNA helicase
MEEYVIGSCLLSEELLIETLDRLEPEHFYLSRSREIYESIILIYKEQGSPADLAGLMYSLRKQKKSKHDDATYIAKLLDIIPITSTLIHHCNHIGEMYKLRELRRLGAQLSKKCETPSDVSEVINEFGTRFIDITSSEKSKTASVGEILPAVTGGIEERYEGKSLIGLQTGIEKLDSIIGGLEPASYTLIGGRPSMGKTALAMNMVTSIAEKNIPIGVFSLEMSSEQLVLRMISGMSRVSITTLRSGNVDDRDWPLIYAAKDRISGWPIFIDETGALSITELRSRAKQMAIKHGIQLIVIDYLQLMRADGQNRNLEIATISMGLKAIAKDLNIPVIALSQLNRSLEARVNKRPMVSDLRDSGSLEQDADLIIFIYRDEVYNTNRDNPQKGFAELIVAKQRNGSLGMVKAMFQGQYAKFTD